MKLTHSESRSVFPNADVNPTVRIVHKLEPYSVLILLTHISLQQQPLQIEPVAANQLDLGIR
jgi:hypothetical protein